MDSRLKKPEENYDALFEGLTEEELEAELAKSDAELARLQNKMDDLATKKTDLVGKKEDCNRRINELDSVIASSQKRIEDLDAKYDRIIEQALPLTGAVTPFDFSKVKSDDPEFMRILQKGSSQKAPAPTPGKYSPPSSTKSSTPSTSGSDLSRASSPSLSGNSSGSDEEKERSKHSPQTKSPAAPVKPAVAIQLPRSTAAIASTLSAANKAAPAPALPKVTPPVAKAVAPAPVVVKTEPKKSGLLANFGFKKKEEVNPVKVTPAAPQQKSGMGNGR